LSRIPANLIPGICLYILLGLVCMLYWPGLHGPLLIDDIPNLYALNRFGQGIIDLQQIFLLTPHGTDRPVAIFSFIGNWLLTGDSVWYLKYTNLLIHLLCGTLVFWICGRLLNNNSGDHSGYNWYIALWTASLWLLSPYLLSTVLYVIQRMTQLSALFSLCGMLCYITGRQCLAGRRLAGSVLIAMSLLCFWPLATLSKQNGILLPLLLLLTEVFFFHADMNSIRGRRLRLVLTAMVCVPGLIVFAMAWHDPAWLFGGYASRNFSVYERLITEARILFDYIGNLLLIPGVSPMSLFHDDFIKSTGLLTPASTLPSFLAWPLILFVAYRARGKKTGLVVYGLVFFFAAHMVESTIIPLELYFEHRNYLPAFGLYFSTVLGVAMLIRKMRWQKIYVLFLLIAPVSFSILTYQRVSVWQTTSRVYLMSEVTHPGSARASEGLAVLFLLNHDTENAIRYLDRTRRLAEKEHLPEFYLKYMLAYCYGNRTAPESIYMDLENTSAITDNMTTIDYLAWFVQSIEEGRCEKMDTTRVTRTLIKMIDAGINKNTSAGNAILYELRQRLSVYADGINERVGD